MPAAAPSSATVADTGDLATLVELSRLFGSDPELVLAGGGNTSVKFDDHLLVKGSGAALWAITPEDFVDLDRRALQALLERDLGTSHDEREVAFKDAVLAARREPGRMQRPSVEAVLHHLMPGRFVAHLHATVVNQFSCCRHGKRLVERHLGEDVVWVELVDPGFALAQALRDKLVEFKAKTARDCPRGVIMQNHGLVVSGDTPDEVRGHLEWLLASLRNIGEEAAPADGLSPGASEGLSPGASDARAPIDETEARAIVNVVGPALRGLLSPAGSALKVVTFDDSPAVVDLVTRQRGRDLAMGGPLTPDQIVYCRSFPLWLQTRPGEHAVELCRRLAAEVRQHTSVYGVPPAVVLVEDLGLFACGDTWSDANTTRQVYIDAIKVMTGALRLGGVHHLPEEFAAFIEHWEVESYRRALAVAPAGPGRASGKVALVTGAAQGFGLEIAQDFAAQGGHVALADVNVAGVSQAAASLVAKWAPGGPSGWPPT